MRNIILIALLVICTVSCFGQFEIDTSKKVNVAAIPIINYDPAMGASFGAMSQLFHTVQKNDTISPTSSTGVFGMYSTNRSYGGIAFTRFYFNEDNWRIKLAAGFGNINFQYWQAIPIIDGVFIGFNTKAAFVGLLVERRVYKKLYAGILGTILKSKTEFDLPDIIPDSFRFDERNYNHLGYKLSYDMREHQINPYNGFNIVFKNSFYREWMNNSDNFSRYIITYNHYYKIKNERNILVSRAKASIAAGDVPFLGQNVVGQDDIRGYTSGKYRDDQVYAIQAEYRWRFYKKFGMVGFFGIATAVERIGDLSFKELLPGLGAGIRYMLLAKERINIGFDVAVGKEDWGIYFRIGESFSF